MTTPEYIWPEFEEPEILRFVEAGEPAPAAKQMDAPDLAENLLQFLRTSIPTYEAAEVLMFLWEHPDKPYTAGQIVDQIKPTEIKEPVVRDYLVIFHKRGLVERGSDEAFRFAPDSEELRSAVDELAKAYNERPVTLIRIIYALAENKIQSFADAFRLQKE